MTVERSSVPLADPPLGTVAGALLGASWRGAPGTDLAPLVGLAVRDNPRRAQLVVSLVLAKHVPAPPAEVIAAGERLGRLVRDALGDGEPPLVIGFCETATGLGHAVAEELPGSDVVHSTRREVPGRRPTLVFAEEHSHAVGHLLAPDDPTLLRCGRPVVLVDDELTSGRTTANIVVALGQRGPLGRVVIATLADLRPAAARSGPPAVSLLDAELDLPADVADRAAGARALPRASVVPPRGRGGVSVLDGAWPTDLPPSGRGGVTAAERAAVLAAVEGLADQVQGELPGGRVLVVGTEELVHVPTRLAAALAARRGGGVLVQSTTRSPVLALDRPGYAVRRSVAFPAPDDPARLSLLHNVIDPRQEMEREPPYSAVVVVTDTPSWSAVGLAEALRPWAELRVLAVGISGRP